MMSMVAIVVMMSVTIYSGGGGRDDQWRGGDNEVIATIVEDRGRKMKRINSLF